MTRSTHCICFRALSLLSSRLAFVYRTESPTLCLVLVLLPQNDVHAGVVRKKSWYETCRWLPCEHLDYLQSDMLFSEDIAAICFIFARKDKDLHSSHLPAPQILRVLKLYYQVASSHLPAPQILRATVVLQSRQFSSSSSPDTPRHQFSSSSSLLKLYYQVASSHLPPPQILRATVVLQSRQFSSSSSPDTPRHQFSSSSSPATPRTKVVLQSRQFSASCSTDCTPYYSCTSKSPVLVFQLPRTHRTLACVSRTRHARSPQRVARAWDKSRSRLHVAHSTCAISAEGCARMGQIALSPACRGLDARDLRRGGGLQIQR